MYFLGNSFLNTFLKTHYVLQTLTNLTLLYLDQFTKKKGKILH